MTRLAGLRDAAVALRAATQPAPFCANLAGPVPFALLVLEASGERRAIDEAERRRLLERVRAGEHVELAFRALTFYQSKAPNRNFIKFRRGALEHLTRSFRGQPFLRDHGQTSVTDRGGTILGAELTKTDDHAAIEMDIRAVKPWAVEGLLDGTIDRFSIGWRPTAPIVCSVHRKPLRGKDGCLCWPGDKVDDRLVEAVFTGADGVEVSAVNVPAVPQAQGIEIRAALSAWLETREHVAAHHGGKMERIATMLGLGGAATEDDLAAALGKLKAKADALDALEVKVEAAEERRKMVEAKLAEHVAAAEAAVKVAIGQRVDAEIERLYATGRLAIARDVLGARVPHPLESHLRRMVDALGFEAFKSYADSLPVLAPIGQPPQLKVTERTDATHPALTNPTVLATIKALGLTVDEVEKYNGLSALNALSGES